MSCGGGSGGGHMISAQPPIFTSAPVTAAAQGAAYSYQVAATDPSGGTVSFVLTTGPTGASLSGSAVSWTPTAGQSRTSNSFTVTATSSENATATQSWTVSPTGIVTVNAVNTYWEPSGAVQVPFTSAASLAISAVVPQPDGSLTVLKGVTTAPGVISIPGVPAGNYWMAIGGINLLPDSTSAYWTSTSTFDAGHDMAATPPAVLSKILITVFDLNLSGLDSVPTQTAVLFQPENNSPALPFPHVANSSSIAVGMSVESNYDWSQVNALLLAQYESVALGPLTNAVLGPSVLLANPSFTDGGTNKITQTLASSPASFDLTVEGSQWTALLNAGPAAPTSYAGAFSVVAEPYVTGRNASTLAGQPNFVLATTATPGPIFAFDPFAPGCDQLGVPFTPANSPAIQTDQDLGTGGHRGSESHHRLGRFFHRSYAQHHDAVPELVRTRDRLALWISRLGVRAADCERNRDLPSRRCFLHIADFRHSAAAVCRQYLCFRHHCSGRRHGQRPDGSLPVFLAHRLRQCRFGPHHHQFRRRSGADSRRRPGGKAVLATEAGSGERGFAGSLRDENPALKP